MPRNVNFVEKTTSPILPSDFRQRFLPDVIPRGEKGGGGAELSSPPPPSPGGKGGAGGELGSRPPPPPKEPIKELEVACCYFELLNPIPPDVGAGGLHTIK